MFTSTDIFALRLMSYFAKHPTRFITSAELAKAKEISDLSPSYVAKICQRLARGGLLISQRGLKGGFRLVQPAPSLAAILDQMGDTLQGMKSCPLHPKKAQACACPFVVARTPFVDFLHATSI